MRTGTTRIFATLTLGLALVLASVLVVGNPLRDDDSQGGVASAQEMTTDRTISVTGTGRVSVMPDTARATIGVQMQNDDLSQALTNANERMEDVIAALRDEGIPSDQIQTTTFTIQVSRDHEAAESPITGYTVINRVQVSVSPVEDIASVIESAIDAGANDIGGISFTVNDNEELVRQAREEAMNNARQTAEHLAELAGVTLGEPVSIQETSTPQPVAQRFDEALAADGAPPIEPGQQQVSVSVSVSYAIE
jgi:uncharacterized protein